MKRRSQNQRRVLLWVISFLVVVSMLCSLIVSLLPRGNDTSSIAPAAIHVLIQEPLPSIVALL